MADSANSDLVNSFIRHAVDLERFKAGERRKALALLKDLEDDLVGMLARNAGSAWTRARITALLSQVRATISTGYTNMRDKFAADMQRLADLETGFVGKAISGAIGVDLVTVEFSASQLKAAVGDAVIEGGPQSEWWSRQAARTEQMFSDTVRKGVLSGSTTDQLVSTLRQGVFKGVLTRNVEALVRTSVASVAAEARDLVYQANTDVIGWIQQHSTLDGRTTQICMAYSGKRWSLPDYKPIGHSMPYNNGVPRHWNCRSTEVPGLPMFTGLGDPTGKKDSARAEKFFKQGLRDQGMDSSEIGRAMRNAQASMDGYVPEGLNYEQWLETKPVAFQKEVLGQGKWELWSQGKITFSDLVSEDGRPLTLAGLEELAS